jgi:hypothetical protein
MGVYQEEFNEVMMYLYHKTIAEFFYRKIEERGFELSDVDRKAILENIKNGVYSFRFGEKGFEDEDAEIEFDEDDGDALAELLSRLQDKICSQEVLFEFIDNVSNNALADFLEN